MELQIGDLVIVKESGKSGMITSISEEEFDIYYCLGDAYMYWESQLTKIPTKFKIGDKVKCIKNLWENGSDQIGTIFEIKNIELDNEQRVIYSQNDVFFSEDELERYSETDMIYNHLNGGRKEMTERVKQTYLAGDLLKKGSIMLRNAESEELRLNGVKIYSPIEDKSINDKSNQTEESNNGLAERIVKNDTRAIIESDIIVIEPQDDAKGTMVELGQLKGMKDASRMMNELIELFAEQNNDSFEDLKYEVLQLANKLDKKVYPHYEDIRRMDLPECADRRSWSVNQYVYGVCLDLTNGKGFYEWDDIVKELHDEYLLPWQVEYIELMEKALEESKDECQKGKEYGTHKIVNVKGIMNKYNLDHEEMYKDIYRMNDLYFKNLTFISRSMKENYEVEIDHKKQIVEV